MPLPYFKNLEDCIGQTPLVRLKRIADNERGNVILVKLESAHPSGSVKDRPAFAMIREAEQRGFIRQGDCLIEPTSGNMGISLAMAAAVMGYRMVLVMPETVSIERIQMIQAYGAEVVLTPDKDSMPGAIDEARRRVDAGEGVMLDQFSNAANPEAHAKGTGAEIWRDSGGQVTHFVSGMGSTGTIMGVGRYLKRCNPDIQIVGVQPDTESAIPGIRRWESEYLPPICDHQQLDRLEYVTQAAAEFMMRRLAREEGILASPSSGGTLAVALRLSEQVRNAVIVSMVYDRGERYLSSGIFGNDECSDGY